MVLRPFLPARNRLAQRLLDVARLQREPWNGCGTTAGAPQGAPTFLSLCYQPTAELSHGLPVLALQIRARQQADCGVLTANSGAEVKNDRSAAEAFGLAPAHSLRCPAANIPVPSGAGWGYRNRVCKL